MAKNLLKAGAAAFAAALLAATVSASASPGPAGASVARAFRNASALLPAQDYVEDGAGACWRSNGWDGPGWYPCNTPAYNGYGGGAERRPHNHGVDVRSGGNGQSGGPPRGALGHVAVAAPAGVAHGAAVPGFGGGGLEGGKGGGAPISSSGSAGAGVGGAHR